MAPPSVGVLGLNGAGKSTLLRITAGVVNSIHVLCDNFPEFAIFMKRCILKSPNRRILYETRRISCSATDATNYHILRFQL